MIRVLGIDTSNYKTSVALTELDEEGATITAMHGRLLVVKPGERGLRQSDALFQHVKALPEILEESGITLTEGISCIAVSTKPRPEEGSYMPVFLAGKSLAESLGSLLQVPVYAYSHQEGHIAAAAYERLPESVERFVAFHFSGGTTEAVLVTKKDCGYAIEKIGGTLDLAFGQLLDRVGVLMGLPFPAGGALDALAMAAGRDKSLVPKVKVQGLAWNVSGMETGAERLLAAQACEPGVLVRTLFERMAEIILTVVERASEEYGVQDFLFSGGVSQSRTLREILARHGKPMTDASVGTILRSGQKLYFGKPELCGDNAAGISILGGRTYAVETGIGNTTQ